VIGLAIDEEKNCAVKHEKRLHIEFIEHENAAALKRLIKVIHG
jgi:hypothetical protein